MGSRRHRSPPTPAQRAAAAAAADSKKYVDIAAKGVGELKKMSDAAQKMQEAGKTLGQINSALAAMKFLSKLSVALQAVSIGLSVLQMFLPMKTKEDMILEGVNELLGRMKNLQSEMETRFDQQQLADDISDQKAALMRVMA